MRRFTLLLSLLIFASATLAACVSNADLSVVPAAAAGCEAPTDDLLNPHALMLPGRSCMTCHSEGGQAEDVPWTAAGTVFDSPTSPCNTGGLEGVKVEIADETRKILITLYTNRSGNFFTSEARNFSQIRVRVSKDGKTQEMQTVQPSTDCPSCHRPGGAAGGRVYLN